MLKKWFSKFWQVCDWLAKWLLVIITIVLGLMDLRWPRVARRSNVDLVYTGPLSIEEQSAIFIEMVCGHWSSLCLQMHILAPNGVTASTEIILTANTKWFSSDILLAEYLLVALLFRIHDAIFRNPAIHLIHKSRNERDPYPTMLHSQQKCTYFYSEWTIAWYGTGAFWHLWNWSNGLLIGYYNGVKWAPWCLKTPVGQSAVQ